MHSVIRALSLSLSVVDRDVCEDANLAMESSEADKQMLTFTSESS